MPVVIGVIVWSGLGLLRADFLYLTDGDVTAERLIEYEWFTGNVGTTISAEYLPKSEVPRLWTGPDDLSGIEPLVWPRSGVAISAEIIALLAIIITLAATIYYRAIAPKHLLWVAACLLLLGVMARFSAEPAWLNNPLDTRTWDFAQKAYLHHAPNGIEFENGAILSGYSWEYAPITTVSDYALFVTLHWEKGSGEAAIDLVSPAIHRATAEYPVPVYASQTHAIRRGAVTYEFDIDPVEMASVKMVPQLRIEGAKGGYRVWLVAW